MSDIKFACPSCQQHIQCDPGYGGMEIACPTCKTRMIVPQLAPPPAPVGAPPPPPQPPGLSVSRSAPAAPPPPTQASPGTRFQPGRPGVGVPGRGVPQRPVSAEAEVWYKTPLPYIGAVVLIFAGLFALAKMNESYVLLYVGPAFLYYLAARITLVVFAFKEGALPGILSLCIEIYAIYFAFSVCESTFLKMFYGSALLVLIGIYILK